MELLKEHKSLFSKFRVYKEGVGLEGISGKKFIRKDQIASISESKLWGTITIKSFAGETIKYTISNSKERERIMNPLRGEDKAEPKITKQCPHCKSEILLGAKKCPQCQSDLRSWFIRHPILTFLVVCFVLGVFIMSIGGVKKEGYIQKVGEVPQQETPKSESEIVKPERTFKIRENVEVGGARWKVLSVKDLGSKLTSTNPFIESKTTTGKFIQVRFEVKNISKDLKSVGNVGLVDSQNREYTPASDVLFWIPNEETLFLIDNINPNITKTYTVVFEVAKDATGLKFRPGGIIVLKDIFIDLGL